MADSNKKGRFILAYNDMKMSYNYNIVIDTETGVNYFFCKGTMGAGLTPLLDAEGKPIITPPEEIEKLKAKEK